MFAKTSRMGLLSSSLSLALLAAGGCASTGEVRYVYQDGQYGVIGLPENTSRWPTHYRDRAEVLMAQHFPQGYEIVRAEEVVEGSRTLTLDGKNSVALGSIGFEPVIKLANIGRTTGRTQADTTAITECRIVYKKAEHPRGDAYASQASLTPEEYLDPNAVVRAQGGPKLPEIKTHTVAKPVPPPIAPEVEEKPAEAGADPAHEASAKD